MGRFEDPELLKMAEEYASTIGQPVEEAMKTALRLAMETQPRQRGPEERARRRAAMREIADRCAARPDFDTRSPDEIIGYDERGLPS